MEREHINRHGCARCAVTDVSIIESYVVISYIHYRMERGRQIDAVAPGTLTDVSIIESYFVTSQIRYSMERVHIKINAVAPDVQ